MDRFPYVEIKVSPSYGDRSSIVWSPMVPFSIRGLSGRFDTAGLVDTGAVETVLPMSIWSDVEPAHRVGEESELLAANGSAIPVKYGTVDLGIKLGRTRYWWSALVGFTETRGESVLGDAAFMRYFAVYFHRPDRFLTVRRVTELPMACMPAR
jgi:predicted aspartyl protease